MDPNGGPKKNPAVFYKDPAEMGQGFTPQSCDLCDLLRMMMKMMMATMMVMIMIIKLFSSMLIYIYMISFDVV